MDSHLRPTHQFPALSRREFLRVAASAGAVGAGAVLLGGCGSDDGNRSPTSTPGTVVDASPETTTIRLSNGIFNPQAAPLYLAKQFLPAEGFTDVRYIDEYVAGSKDQGIQEMAAGEIDIGLFQSAPLTVAVDRGDPLVVLAGVHSSLFEVFGSERIQSLRDLKGRGIAGKRDPTDPVYPFVAALLAFVGVDVKTEVDFVDVTGTVGIAQAWQAGTIDALILTRPNSTIFRNAKLGHVVIDGLVDPPWSQQFGVMATGNRDFVEKHPVAAKRALRAILKATDVCAKEPERAARYLVDKAFTTLPYDFVLDGIPGRAYAAWREFNPEDTMRFYALRLREAGLVKSNPDELIARATDWRYLNEIKQELGVA